ncbi:hypothetical protein NQ314_004755 [Rhamnusium bicolor]|uniref:ZAD domain-containing protein n=1 Tax=Rhamnusium bicolor TaxID=1586634 RepID=A0AAV8ZJ24_9CUCU|nr:hypothetical protein NQ314_004755 [Rhamnusium bicolor]
MKYGEKICRFCLKICYNFQAIEEMTRKMLDMLLLKNLSISEEPVICNKCEDTLKKFFDFKSACFYTRDCIVHFVKKCKECKSGSKRYMSEQKGEKKMLFLKLIPYAIFV